MTQMPVGPLIYYLSKVAAQTLSTLLYLEVDILHTAYIEHSFHTWINKKIFILILYFNIYIYIYIYINPLNAELNPICYLLALLGAHHFLHISRIRVKSLILRLLMSYIYIYIYIYIYTHTHTHIWSTSSWCF